MVQPKAESPDAAARLARQGASAAGDASLRRRLEREGLLRAVLGGEAGKAGKTAAVKPEYRLPALMAGRSACSVGRAVQKPRREVVHRTEAAVAFLQAGVFAAASAMASPLQVTPIQRICPQTPPRPSQPHRPAATPQPSAVVELDSQAPPPIPPRTYKGFSRVPPFHVAPVPVACEARGAGALPPAGAAKVSSPASSAKPLALPWPAGARCGLPALVATFLPLALPRSPGPVAPGTCPDGGGSRLAGGAFLEYVEAAAVDFADAPSGIEPDSPASRAGGAGEPPNPALGLQRSLLDEGARMQRIIASDPAYAAAVAAFYVSTAALGARR